MNQLEIVEKIHASAKKVWQVLWSDASYRMWTAPFHEGSYAVTDWKEGSRVLFLGPDGSGMFSEISVSRPYEYIEFTHLGAMKNFEEQAPSEETKAWVGMKEIYSLHEEGGMTTLTVNIAAEGEMADFFKDIFPKALAIVKELSEQTLSLMVESEIEAPVEKVWTYFTAPEHIMQWNQASDDWHTPHAENDLRTGGKFLSRMAAKDGSFSFDFEGIYDSVVPAESLAYTLGDNRKVSVNFNSTGNKTTVSETFDAETENAPEFQQQGWQLILNNFKKYVENN